MARPKSNDKRIGILLSATRFIAEQGLGVPTSRIAKGAGVAEGTLFTYFENKDVLLNQLYLELKAELRELMFDAYPERGTPRARAQHVWHRYVQWGVSAPEKFKTLAQLGVSDRISEESLAIGARLFEPIFALLQGSIASDVLRKQPAAFVGAIMVSLAEISMNFTIREPKKAKAYAEAGFEVFWNAISAA